MERMTSDRLIRLSVPGLESLLSKAKSQVPIPKSLLVGPAPTSAGKSQTFKSPISNP